MTIDLDIVIETDVDTVDMKAGLDTMQGISDTVRYVADTILNENVPERNTHKSNVRTSLKKSFRGSYGHTFSLDISKEEHLKKLRNIGRQAFIELIKYFIDEALYQEPNKLSDKAQKIIDKLGEKEDEIINQLRKSSLKKSHEISVKFKHDVKFRYRLNRDNQTVIAKFNTETAKVFEAKRSKEAVDLKAVITRLNIHTGNGRLQIENEDETIAFGFIAEYKHIKVEAKKLFSANLDFNNGTEKDDWKYLKLSAFPLVLRDGKVVKYFVKGVYE